MKNRPSMRSPNTPARLAPARTSAGLMRSAAMEEYRRENETGYSSKFLFRSGFLDGFDSNPRRAHPQPEERQPRAAARAPGGDHRPVRLGQELARLRYAVRRRAAALRRVAVGLRAHVPEADEEARRRPD